MLPDHALWWPAERTLFVADLHLGKDDAFRAAGLPVPGVSGHDLVRLGCLIDQHQAQRLVILGDLFHHRSGRSPGLDRALRAWRDARPHLAIWLLRGNHDTHAGDPPPGWADRCDSGPLRLGPWHLAHHPERQPGRLLIAGHHHPAVSLSARGRPQLRLPCFVFGTSLAILPAFGAFTGQGDYAPQLGDRIFVSATGQILEVKIT